MRFRFSLAGLLMAVAAAAVASASFAFAGAGWETTLATATIAVLATALLVAVLRPRAAQGFWAGMAIWGWLYLALVFGPWADRLAPWMITTVALDYTAAQMPRAEPPVDNGWNTPTAAPGPAGMSTLVSIMSPPAPNYNAAFVAIGQFWCALLLGCIGGWLARRITAPGASPERSPGVLG
ncbi:MAG TPA: hypothetical protein VGX76_11520 [Pirellulales bacterium]|jgi:hypothetical protein|nr:hypothetical protein [Pirellulales bacterium]